MFARGGTPAASPLICVFSEGNVRVVYGGDGKSAGLCTRAVCNYACVFEREKDG